MDLSKLADLNKVIIIDNNEKEGRAISNALDKQGVASHFVHFRGVSHTTELVEYPNARLIFLDLDLDQTLPSDDAKANLALTCLSKTIGDGAHYALVVWSGHTDDPLVSVFLEMLKERGEGFYPFVEPIIISKKACKNRDRDASFSATKINRILKPQLAGAADFDLFAKWELEVNKVMSNFLADLLDKEDQDSLSGKLHALARAYAGGASGKNVSLYSLLTLNNALKGTIDSAIASLDYRKNNRLITAGTPLDDDLKSKLNMHLMLNPDITIGPGTVFKCDKSHCSDLVNNYSDCQEIVINITPLCDFAQGKGHFSYMVHGLLVPDATPKKKLKSKDSGYEIHNQFLHDDSKWRIFISLASLESIPMNSRKFGKDKIWFKLRDSIVIDLQHRVSSHNSRPGHALLD